MEDRVFMVKTLGEVLNSIENIPEPEGGFYALYVVEDAKHLTENMTCAVIFESDDDEQSYISEFAKVNRLGAAADLWLVRDVIEAAKSKEPNLTVQDLVDALNYYLDNDAYIQFDES